MLDRDPMEDSNEKRVYYGIKGSGSLTYQDGDEIQVKDRLIIRNGELETVLPLNNMDFVEVKWTKGQEDSQAIDVVPEESVARVPINQWQFPSFTDPLMKETLYEKFQRVDAELLVLVAALRCLGTDFKVLPVMEVALKLDAIPSLREQAKDKYRQAAEEIMGYFSR